MMISPAKWIERVGVGGQLVAYFKAVCVHFALAGVGGGEGGAGGGAPSVAGAAAKCAPVLCLLLIVLAHRTDMPRKSLEQRRYAAWVSVGLALSALGDALLVWSLLEAGMAAFALAHAAYCAAFGLRPLAPRTALPVYAGALLYGYFVHAPGLLRWLAVVYSLVLGTMAWRALARASAPPAPGLARACPPAPHSAPQVLARAAAAGALLFCVSDASLGVHLFRSPLPYAEVIIMSTYYLAQLGIAVSALPPPDRSAPPFVPSPSDPPTPTPAPPAAH